MNRKITVQELCTWLEMPSEVTKRLAELQKTFPLAMDEAELALLTDPEHWEAARTSLKEKIGADADGMKILLCMMQSMADSYEKYTEKGITKEIFIDTMKCFPRFIREHKESYGTYGFDRDFWTGRQLSLRLFRLGELEFELADRAELCEEEKEPGGFVISIHIPSDAALTPEKCEASYEMAERFFAEYFPEAKGCEYRCNSWLLSPALKELLPEKSHILAFQNRFALQKWDQASQEYLEWVYKRRDLPFEELPEDTSLQRNMKMYLKNGGKIGEGLGILKDRTAEKR